MIDEEIRCPVCGHIVTREPFPTPASWNCGECGRDWTITELADAEATAPENANFGAANFGAPDSNFL